MINDHELDKPPDGSPMINHCLTVPLWYLQISSHDNWGFPLWLDKPPDINPADGPRLSLNERDLAELSVPKWGTLPQHEVRLTGCEGHWSG